jgi:hypothetical protein
MRKGLTFFLAARFWKYPHGNDHKNGQSRSYTCQLRIAKCGFNIEKAATHKQRKGGNHQFDVYGHTADFRFLAPMVKKPQHPGV